MRKIALAPAGTDLTSAVPQTAVELASTPAAPGFDAVAVIAFKGATGTPTVKVQGSDNGTDWTDLYTVSDLLGDVRTANVTLQKFMRFNVSAVGTAGDVEAFLLV